MADARSHPVTAADDRVSASLLFGRLQAGVLASPGPTAWEEFNTRQRAKPPAGAMTLSEARVRAFDLAGLDDDQTLSLRTAWRAAAQRHHPDFGGKTTTMQELVDLKELLHTQPMWRTV